MTVFSGSKIIGQATEGSRFQSWSVIRTLLSFGVSAFKSIIIPDFQFNSSHGTWSQLAIIRRLSSGSAALALGIFCLPFLSGNLEAQTNISSAAYLASQPKPNFAAGHHLPHLSRYGYSPSSNTFVELAKNWGYALDMGDGSSVDILSALKNTNSTQWGFIRLAKSDPNRYKLAVGMNQRYMKPIPDDFYVTNSMGYFVGAYGTNTWNTNGGPRVASPEGNEAYWSNSAAFWMAPIAAVQSIAQVTIVLNAGEYGLNTFFNGISQAWCQDPRVQAATNLPPWNKYVGGGGSSALSWPLWFDYSSFRRTRQYQYTTDLLRASLPNRELYIHYETAGEQFRSATKKNPIWATGNHYNGYYTRALSDYPNFECYYKHFNDGWTTTSSMSDILVKYLNGVGAHINYGSATNYSWVCSGYYRNGSTNDFGNITNYYGFLKCAYTGGMVGGVASYFSAFTDTPFPANNPPNWLLQMQALSHVHALFSHLENYTFKGELLPGSKMHSMSMDQPSYEFTNSVADPTARVLARKLKASDDWLICAWAAAGEDRNVNVNIPQLGTVSILARASGAVYKAKISKITLVDVDGLFPTKSLLNAPGNLSLPTIVAQ